MSTRLAGLVIGILVAGSGPLAAAQTKPTTTAQTPAQIAALRAAQLAAQTPRMPDLVGQMFQAAQQDPRVVGLKLRLVGRAQQTTDYKPGTIIGHEPGPNAPVKPGTSVTVFVAVQPPPGRGGSGDQTGDGPRMPNLLGQPFESAQQDRRVIDLKLRLIPREQITNDRRPGTIVDHEPGPGSPVKLGTPVTVFVAVPVQQPPPVARMPDLVGQLFQVAQQDRQVIDLKLRLIPRDQFTNDRRPGTIVEQELRPGSPVKLGTPVTVFVAVPVQQPPPVPRMPDLVGQFFQAAQQDGRVLRLNLQLVPQSQPTPDERPGVILRHDPPADSPVKPGMPVTVFVAVAPPPPVLYPMPDLVGRQLSLAVRDASVIDLKLRLIPQDDLTAPGQPGTIVRQSVPAGTHVETGRAVTVLIASGVAVPGVVQQQADVAERRIAALGLNPRRSEEVSRLTPGVVLRQVPEAGVLVARGAAVAITVAVPPRVKIPDLVGRTRADATQALAQLELRASSVDDPGSSLPPDQVVAQVPGAGTEVVINATVRIAVATGVEVPTLTGLSVGDAQRAAAERGLSFESTNQESDAAPPGQVFQQQPASGTRVARAARVVATVATPVLITVPNLIGLTRQRAAAVLDGAGLRVASEPDATAATRLVERQQPAANLRVARLSVITLFVAAPPPPPAQQPVPATPVPAPAPGPALTPVPGVEATPPTAVPAVQPGAGQPPAQSGTGTPAAPVAVPIQPLLPPWLLTLLVALVTIGVSTFKLWWPASSTPPPPIQATTPGTPPPAIDVRPERGDTSLRLEVMGRSLISMDVRIRVERGLAEQTLDVQGDALIVEERRLYE